MQLAMNYLASNCLIFPLSCFMISISLTGTIRAQTPEEQQASDTLESSQQMTRTVAGQQLKFLVQEPVGIAPEKGWPLLLFLHGYGECGDDLSQVKKHGPPKLISHFEELAGCVVISPQCPRHSWWRTETLKLLVDEFIAGRDDIDHDRLYVTGLSMGGYGIWSFISRHPNYFAAAIPICGGGNPFNLPANLPGRKRGITNEFSLAGLKKADTLPIWTFHGSDDRSVPLVETKTLVESLREAGNRKVKFTVYQGAGHVATWEKAYDSPETWKWLFSQ